MDLDDTIERFKTLIAQRDAIYSELAALLGGERQPATKRTIKCGTCGQEGHSARTCSQKPQE